MYGGGARELACCWPRDATPFLSCVRHTVRRISVDAAGLYELGLFPPGRKEKKKNNSRVPRSETWPPPNEAESKKMTAHARLRPGEKKTGEREEEDGRKRSNKRTNVSTIKNKKRDKLSSSSSSFNVLVKSLSG
jgi:hypothetical protein